MCPRLFFFFFFFNDTATTEIYTLSLHDALPIYYDEIEYLTDCHFRQVPAPRNEEDELSGEVWYPVRSEEHTSELQSPCNLVCRLLLEKKKKQVIYSRDLRNSDALSDDRAGHASS